MFKQRNLKGILGTFTQAKNELQEFISSNNKEIANLDNKLQVAKGEQTIADNALTQIKLIVGDK